MACAWPFRDSRLLVQSSTSLAVQLHGTRWRTRRIGALSAPATAPSCPPAVGCAAAPATRPASRRTPSARGATAPVPAPAPDVPSPPTGHAVVLVPPSPHTLPHARTDASALHPMHPDGVMSSINAAQEACRVTARRHLRRQRMPRSPLPQRSPRLPNDASDAIPRRCSRVAWVCRNR